MMRNTAETIMEKATQQWRDGGPFDCQRKRLADAAEIIKPEGRSPNPLPKWQSFPIASLPETVREFCRHVAVSVGCDASFVAQW